MSSNARETGVPMPRLEDDVFLAAALRALPDLILILDSAGDVRWGNPALEEFFGLTAEEGIGRSALEFIHPDDVDLALRSLGSVQRKDVGSLIEIRVLSATGWRLLEVIGRPAPELAPGHIIFQLRDITERRRYEVANNDDALFRSLLQHSAFVTMLVSPDLVIQSISAALARILGRDPEDVEGRSVDELFVSDARTAVREAFATARDSATAATPLTIEATGIGAHAHVDLLLELTIVSLKNDPVLNGFVVSMRDLSDRVRAERELREALSLVTATLESTADGILVVDLEGRVIGSNRRFAELWRLPEAVLESREDAAQIAAGASQLVDPDAFISGVVELYKTPEREIADLLHFADGRVFERYSRPQRIGDEIVGRVWCFRDVTERVHLEERLAHEASHDSLTGLADQALFVLHIEEAIATTKSGELAALFFVDVDGLKEVNDQFGHLAGDEVIVHVAQVLQSCARPGDLVARLGGDEFGLLVRDLDDRDETRARAEVILQSLRQGTPGVALPASVSASVGVVRVTAGSAPLELLGRADAAMYRAKRAGRGRYALYEDDPEPH
jgi:diguanylate cyclase (GGDEF)-like protein/PAS domain S-box-containing protein